MKTLSEEEIAAYIKQLTKEIVETQPMQIENDVITAITVTKFVEKKDDIHNSSKNS